MQQQYYQTVELPPTCECNGYVAMQQCGPNSKTPGEWFLTCRGCGTFKYKKYWTPGTPLQRNSEAGEQRYRDKQNQWRAQNGKPPLPPAPPRQTQIQQYAQPVPQPMPPVQQQPPTQPPVQQEIAPINIGPNPAEMEDLVARVTKLEGIIEDRGKKIKAYKVRIENLEEQVNGLKKMERAINEPQKTTNPKKRKRANSKSPQEPS